MKRLLISLVILMSAVSLSFAQGPMQRKEGEMGVKGMHGGGIKACMTGGMHSMMYSMMVHHIFIKANTLNLTDTQRKELSAIPEKYIYPMIHKEADLKISHMKIISMLHDPDFDPAKVKAEIKTPSEINLEMANMAIDALAGIRNAIGVDNFKKVAEIKPHDEWRDNRN